MDMDQLQQISLVAQSLKNVHSSEAAYLFNKKT